MDGKNENDAAEVRSWWGLVDKLRALNCAVVVIHHMGKGDFSEYRGSTDIKAAADRFFTFEKIIPAKASEDCPLTKFRLERTKCRMAFPEFMGKTTVDVSAKGEFTITAKRKLGILEMVLSNNSEINQTDFIAEADLVGISERKAIAFLNDKALVKSKPGKGKTRHYP